MTPAEQIEALRTAADTLLAEAEGQGGTYGMTRDAMREALQKSATLAARVTEVCEAAEKRAKCEVSWRAWQPPMADCLALVEHARANPKLYAKGFLRDFKLCGGCELRAALKAVGK